MKLRNAGAARILPTAHVAAGLCSIALLLSTVACGDGDGVGADAAGMRDASLLDVATTDALADVGTDAGAQDAFVMDSAVDAITTDAGIDASAAVYPGSNVRRLQGMGVREVGQDWPTRGWLSRAYNRHLANVIASAPAAFAPDWVHPLLTFSVSMANLFVDESLPMTMAELGDENHPNYIWNNGDDGLAEALEDTRVTGSEGVRIVIVLADSATGTTRAVPDFFDPSWFFIGANNEGRNEHLRYEIPAAREASIAVHGALLRKFGNDPGLGGLILSEYYTNSPSAWPPGFDNEAHKVGRAAMWAPIVAHAPLDENGHRVAILQVNFRPTNDGTTVTAQTMFEAGVGISQPDPDMFTGTCGQSVPLRSSCNSNTTGGAFQDAFGVYPGMPSQDSRYARQRRVVGDSGWTDPAIQSNMLGHEAGDRPPVTMANLGWYRTYVEPVSASTFTVDTTGESVDGAWDEVGLIEMLRRFGPGGSDVSGDDSFPRRIP